MKRRVGPTLSGRRAVALAGVILAGAVATVHADGLSAVAALGRQMFFDPALSASGAMSCAFCHDPANHYGPQPGVVVEQGGPGLDRPGIRTVPSIAYASLTPPFSIGPENATSEAAEALPMQVAETTDTVPFSPATAITKLVIANQAPPAAKSGDTSGNMVARGGLFWDGRAQTLQDQAEGPLLSPFEMANADIPTLAARLRAAYAKPLGRFFGDQILKDDRMTVDEAAYALARFQMEDPSFHPFSSKYDAWLAGKATLTDAESRGRALFEDPKKGNCAACHLDRPDATGKPPLFTDFEFEALALPRNPAIPANGDPAHHDLGLCGPLRQDAPQAANCGLFKTPTLRNVATRSVFFHNGAYTTLTDAVEFYALRDTDPARIYPRGPDGSVEVYNDLPPRYRGNIDRTDAPLNRHAGDPPALTKAEVGDIVAFLNTLTDGWHP